MTSPFGLEGDAAPRRRPARAGRHRWAGAALTAPALALIAVFFHVPLVMTLWMSLHDWPLLGARRFIGLENYRNALGDVAFREAVLFTLEYTLITTPVLLLSAFALALLVRPGHRGARVFQGVYFMPVVIGLASGSFLWLFMFQSGIGPTSDLADRLGLASRDTDWFAGTTSALLVVIAMVTWKIVGLQMLLLLAGLRAIPVELEEAARVDGADRWQTLRHITLPLLSPTLALVLVFSVAGSLLAFDQFYIMTGGGPANSTITAVYEIYRTSFIQFRLGLGAAFSALLMIALVMVSAIQMYLLRSSRAGSET
ncbi:carbohydrate ABC transporter permease [Streptomyces sp. NL15-2K]|uniref:carbohydrate ABC transporter permease n=1 Tax=Streptomyces sp. NL15-2K TaxID=376149 RepID=UPI000FF9D4D4|nr:MULTISPECIES: sugar ABC transporter permease [Actinomycetes]WKX11088.1 sugar ABC transporter permease [Kutzneria buriramensis]GCB47429.1 sugar ABC transporter [Streptomyces sp. NL15-2K]